MNNKKACGSQDIANSLQLVACGFNNTNSTVHYSKQLVLDTFFSISFPLQRGETPKGKEVKKASLSVANLQRGEAFGFNRSSCRFSGKSSEVELTIRAC